jgi:hypothetical protein
MSGLMKPYGTDMIEKPDKARYGFSDFSDITSGAGVCFYQTWSIPSTMLAICITVSDIYILFNGFLSIGITYGQLNGFVVLFYYHYYFGFSVTPANS